MKYLLISFQILVVSTLIFPQWQMLNGPYETQKVKFLYNHPNGTLFAIGFDKDYDNNIIYRSTNFGQTWSKVLFAPNHDQFNCISGDSNNVVFVGDDGQKIYISSNNGDTWASRLNTNIASSYAYDIVSNSLGYLFVARGGGIWKSSDGGTIWNLTLNRTTWDILLLNDDILATNRGGISYSSDYGTSWEFRSNGILSNDYCYHLVQDNENVLFMSSFSRIYKSTDNGFNWSIIADSVNSRIYFDLNVGSNGYLYATSMYEGIFVSTNKGNDWNFLPPPPAEQFDCIITDNQNNLFAGTNRGLYKYSEPDSTWYLGTLYKDLGVIQSFEFCSDNGIYASTSMRLWNSTDSGENWNYIIDQNIPYITSGLNDRIFISSPFLYSDNCSNSWVNATLNNFETICIGPDNNLYRGGIVVYKSSDNGTSWDLLGYPSIYGAPQNKDTKVNLSGDIFVSQYGIQWIGDWYEYFGTRRSTDNGATFHNIYNSKVVYSIEIDQNNIVYLGTRGGGVLKSDSNLTTWTSINSGLTNPNVNDLIISPDGALIAGTDNGVFRYWDELNYWSQLNPAGLSSTKIKSLKYHSGILYAGTIGGLAYFLGELPVEIVSFSGSLANQIVTLNWATASETNNSGFEIQRKFKNNNWTTIGFVKGNGTTTNQNSYTFSDNLLEFGLFGNVFYRLKQVDYDGTYFYSDEIEIDLPQIDFVLFQNYPNPFNPNTKISFSIPTKTKVKLEIIDLLGNVLSTLINSQEMNPGNYEFDFDGSDLASGIYFYSLKTSEFCQTKKMILLK